MKIFLTFAFIILSLSAHAGVEDKIKKLNWNGIDVIWLQDERFPTYTISIYFADGALSDEKGFEGETENMFSLLDSGTRRFSQKDIVDNLEFYGVGYGASVTHEYANYSISGLVKDIVPTVKKVCHLFVDSTFPKAIIRKEIKRSKDGIKNSVNNPGALASRAFRELSLKGTAFEVPSGGKLKNYDRFNGKRFKQKLEYFNKNVKKRIYIAGPKSALAVQNLFQSDCNWKSDASFVRVPKAVPENTQEKPNIYLVTLPKVNQAQVRIGRTLAKSEIGNVEIKSLLSEYLGGGFTSQLMREIRVKRGLTYGIGSFVGPQKHYGRAGISTSTRNDKVFEIVDEIKNVIEKLNRGEVETEDFQRAKGSLTGGHPFRFENLNSFLDQLNFLDHVERSYGEIYDIPAKIKEISVQQMIKESQNVFDWKKQTIVVLGSKSLQKQLEKIGKVKVISYKKFL